MFNLEWTLPKCPQLSNLISTCHLSMLNHKPSQNLFNQKIPKRTSLSQLQFCETREFLIFLCCCGRAKPFFQSVPEILKEQSPPTFTFEKKRETHFLVVRIRRLAAKLTSRENIRHLKFFPKNRRAGKIMTKSLYNYQL